MGETFWGLYLGVALILVFNVDGVAHAALAHILPPSLARVLVHALLVALRSALRALVDVNAPLSILPQPQSRPVYTSDLAQMECFPVHSQQLMANARSTHIVPSAMPVKMQHLPSICQTLHEYVSKGLRSWNFNGMQCHEACYQIALQ